jgi:hypothetical protein
VSRREGERREKLQSDSGERKKAEAAHSKRLPVLKPIGHTDAIDDLLAYQGDHLLGATTLSP